MDAGNMLKPALARGELHCVGATTLDEYRKYIEKDAALERRFQKVLVDEPSVESTIAILRGLQEKYEVHHGVDITDPAIVAAVQDRVTRGTHFAAPVVDAIDVSTELARRFGLPLWRFGQSGTEATMDVIHLMRAVTGRPPDLRGLGQRHAAPDGLAGLPEHVMPSADRHAQVGVKAQPTKAGAATLGHGKRVHRLGERFKERICRHFSRPLAQVWAGRGWPRRLQDRWSARSEMVAPLVATQIPVCKLL